MMPITSGFVPEYLDGRIPWSARSFSIAVLRCCSHAVGARVLLTKE
jgi:hypothetical protein